jgi:hypothetical protein
MSADLLREAVAEIHRDACMNGDDNAFMHAIADWLKETHANLSTYNAHAAKHAFAVARAYLGRDATP